MGTSISRTVQGTEARGRFFFCLQRGKCSFGFKGSVAVHPRKQRQNLGLGQGFKRGCSLRTVQIQVLRRGRLLTRGGLPVLKRCQVQVSKGSCRPEGVKKLQKLCLRCYCLLKVLPGVRPSVSSGRIRILFQRSLLGLGAVSGRTGLLYRCRVSATRGLFSLGRELRGGVRRYIRRQGRLHCGVQTSEPRRRVRSLGRRVGNLARGVKALEGRIILYSKVTTHSGIVRRGFGVIQRRGRGGRRRDRRRVEQDH